MSSKTVFALLVASFAVGTLVNTQKIACRKFPSITVAPQYFLSGGEWRMLASLQERDIGITLSFKQTEEGGYGTSCTSSSQLIAVLTQGGQTIERDWDFLPHNGLISDYNRRAKSSGVGRIILAVTGPNAYYCYAICTYGEDTLNIMRCYGTGNATYTIANDHLKRTNILLPVTDLVRLSLTDSS